MTDNEMQENEKESQAAAYVQLGQTTLMEGDFNAATAHFEHALSIADPLGLPAIELQALYGLTQASAGANKPSQAVRYGEQVIDKARQANAQAEEVQAIQTLTGILAENGNFGETLPHLLRGVEIARQKQDNDWELKFLSDLGMAYYLNDDLANADTYLQQAYDNAVRFQKKLEEAILAGRLSSVRADLGKLEAAIELNKHAVELAKDLNDPILKAEQLVLLGMNHLELDVPDQAEAYLQQAKKIYLELDEIQFLVQVEKLLHEIHNQENI